MIEKGYEDDRLVVVKVLGRKFDNTGAMYVLVRMKESGNEIIVPESKIVSKLPIKEKWIKTIDNSTGVETIYEDVADMYNQTKIPATTIRRCLRENKVFLKRNMSILYATNCKMTEEQIQHFMNNYRRVQ
jgi:hypothetical protein